jgi:hypothetical protein
MGRDFSASEHGQYSKGGGWVQIQTVSVAVNCSVDKAAVLVVARGQIEG